MKVKIKVGGSDNYSVFKMMEEGILDLDKEKKQKL